MHKVLVQQVAVLVLLHGGVEQAGPILQAELPHSLLDEVKVLVFVVKILLQVRHIVGLGNNHYEVKSQVPERISWSYVWSLQRGITYCRYLARVPSGKASSSSSFSPTMVLLVRLVGLLAASNSSPGSVYSCQRRQEAACRPFT